MDEGSGITYLNKCCLDLDGEIDFDKFRQLYMMRFNEGNRVQFADLVCQVCYFLSLTLMLTVERSANPEPS